MTLVIFISTFARAQNSQFLFDPNGNLLVQTEEVVALPQILAQPQNRIVGPDEAATFTVVAADTRLLSYQWRFNGTNISGTTNDAVLLQNVSTNNEGEYRVVLTNPSGSITSAPAMLWTDSDADGVPDSWELAHFGSLTNSATTDKDGDGSSNLQEFQNDTNPADTNSVRYQLFVIREGGVVVKSPDKQSYDNGETVTITITTSSNELFHAWLGDVVTRDNPIMLVMTNNKTVAARFTPITFTWTNSASGDWETATNWTPNLAPGLNDSVVLTTPFSGSSITVSLNTPADCLDVTLSGLSSVNAPTLTGSGTLTVRGNFSWTAGTMSGNGRTILEGNAVLNFSSQANLVTRALENGGNLLWTGGTIALNNSVITNRPGALFHAGGSSTIGVLGGSPRFDNAGTFRKSGSGGTTIGLRFNNYGAVEIQTATLNLAAGGTNEGSISVPAGAALVLSGGDHVAGGSSSITGGGQFTVSGGTATLAGLVNVSGSNTFSGGTANLIGNYICTNNTLTVSGLPSQPANFSGFGQISPTVLNMSGGTLTGTSEVTVNSVMNWTAGVMSGTGRTIIAPGATLYAAFPSQVNLVTRTLENGGTVLWANGTFALDNSVITNRPGALFHAQGAGLLGILGGRPRFDNAGTFRKSGSTGTTTFGSGVNFTNSGTVDIRSGILLANGGYVSSSNALLNCALGGTTAGMGYGQLQVAGTVTLNGALSVDFTNGFSPALNDSFTVLSAGTRNGTFADFFYPSNTLTMQLSNSPNSVIVRATDFLASIPQPMLLPPEILGSDFKLTWTAVSNTVYRVEFNSDLSPSNWMALPGDVLGQSNTANKLDPLTPSNRLYRVRVLP